MITNKSAKNRGKIKVESYYIIQIHISARIFFYTLFFAITIDEASRNDGCDARFSQVRFGGGKLSEYDFCRFSG